MPPVPSTDVRINIAARWNQATAAFRQIEQASNRLERRIEGLDLRFRGLDRVMAYIAAGSAIALTAQFVRMTAELERTQLQIAAFERDWDKVGDVMNEVLNLVDRVPFTLNTMTTAFVRLKAAGLDPIVDEQGNGPLKDLADAVAAMGGSDEIFKRATIAIQQMAGKGVISMEELRQQLGEAVPLAMRLMAQELDMSVGELISSVSRGELEFQRGIDAFFEGARPNPESRMSRENFWISF